MTVATDLLAVVARLSSAERELLNLRLGNKWKDYLANPSALSNTQLMELICTLRRLTPAPADVLFETIANSIWVLPVAPADGTEVVIPNTTLCPFVVNGVTIDAEIAAATFIYEATSASWLTLFSDCAAPVLPTAHDFGTTSQGPAATPYSVPASTVEHVILGTDPCGNSIRKIITTTYTGRSVANAAKALPAGWNAGAGTFYPDTYLTQSATSAETMAFAALYGFPNPILFNPFNQFGGDGYGSWAGTGHVDDAGGGQYNLIIDCNIPSYGAAPGTWTLIPNFRTNYYLDTHIVWTYDIATA